MVYIPGGGGKEKFAELGLDSLLEPGVSVLPFSITAGPDGAAGSLVVFDSLAFPTNTPRVYDQATQKWEPAARDGDLLPGRYWLGCVTADKPRPEELQRDSLFDGEPVELDDHRVWVVPVADFMPERIVRDRQTGEEKSVPKDEHTEFVRLANAAYQLFMGDGFSVMLGQRQITIPNGHRLATVALMKNYRVNADVIDLLGLLDRAAIVSVAMVATGINLAARVMEQKKSMESPFPAAV